MSSHFLICFRFLWILYLMICYPISFAFIALTFTFSYLSFISMRIMPMSPSFSIIFLFISTIPCPKHDIKLYNYTFTITMTTHGMCLWSRYPVLDIICECQEYLQNSALFSRFLLILLTDIKLTVLFLLPFPFLNEFRPPRTTRNTYRLVWPALLQEPLLLSGPLYPFSS